VAKVQASPVKQEPPKPVEKQVSVTELPTSSPTIVTPPKPAAQDPSPIAPEEINDFEDISYDLTSIADGDAVQEVIS